MRRAVSVRAGRHCVVAVGALWLCGCAAVRGPSDITGSEKPGLRTPAWLGGVALREGDLIIVRSVDFESALSARHIAEGGYSHSMILARDAHGRARLLQAHRGGIQALAFPAALDDFARAAVLRLRNADSDTAARLGAAARGWMARPDRRRFVFHLDVTEDDAPRRMLNCVSLLNIVYRDAGLPPPFVRREPRRADAWTAEAIRVAGFDFMARPAPADALDHPAFETIATGWNPRFDRTQLAGMDELADVLRDLVTAGFRPRAPPFFTRLLVRATKRLRGFPDATRELAEARATILDFANRVEEALDRHLRRHPDADADRVRAMTRRYAESVAHRYFKRAVYPPP